MALLNTRLSFAPSLKISTYCSTQPQGRVCIIRLSVSVSDLGQMACGRIPATLSLSSIWVPFQVGSKAGEHHKRASTSKSPTIWPLRKKRRGFAKAPVRRGFFPVLPCQGSRLCYLSQNEPREEWKTRTLRHEEFPQPAASFFITNKTVQDVVLHVQPDPMCHIEDIYVSAERKAQTETPTSTAENNLKQVRANILVLAMRFVMTKQHSRTRKPLVTRCKFSLNKVS